MDPVDSDSGAAFSKMLEKMEKMFPAGKQNKSMNIAVPVSKADIYYNMKHKKRGYAVIFQHICFDPKLKKAEEFEDRVLGACRDRDMLKDTFEHLGFEVIVHDQQKLTVEKVKSAMMKIARQDFSDCDCLVIVVLSHGKIDRICAYDAWYHVDMLTEKLMPKECPSLVGKPKILILNVCQGKKLDEGCDVTVQVDTVQVDGGDRNGNLVQTDGNQLQTYRIPSHADFLFAYSTVKDYVSFRDDDGSWYVKAFCQIFKNQAFDTDILTLLTYVHRYIAVDWEVPTDGDYARMKQMPCVTHTLTRLLKFHPK